MSTRIMPGRAFGAGADAGVLAVIQAQINAQQLMLNEIQQVKTDVEAIRTEMTTMYHDLKDSITILYAEQDTLKSIVCKAAYDAAKYHLLDEGQTYPIQGSAEEAQIREMAGFGMRYQWKLLKDHFCVSKYIHIRRVDFNAAVNFLGYLNLQTGEFALAHSNWVLSREALKEKRKKK